MYGQLSGAWPMKTKVLCLLIVGMCHQGDGEARDKLDLTYRGGGLFKEPYVLLIGNPTWGAAYHPPDRNAWRINDCVGDIAAYFSDQSYGNEPG